MNRTLRLGLGLLVLIAFLGLSNLAVAQYGYLGLWAHGFKDLGSTQIIVDLMLMSGFGIVWMILDARERRATVWPFVLVTIGAGSIGPLAYVLVRELRSRPARPEGGPPASD